MNKKTVVTAFLPLGRGAKTGTLTNQKQAFQASPLFRFVWNCAEPKVSSGIGLRFAAVKRNTNPSSFSFLERPWREQVSSGLCLAILLSLVFLF